MKIWGLTGSIGMGKSTAARMLARMGVPVHDSDVAVHQALGVKGPAVTAVAKAFPGVLAADGSIDRRALGKIVFGNDALRQKLEQIVHPHVWESQRRFIARHRRAGHKLVVLDIPLLYETGRGNDFNRVIVVTAPPHIQRRRVMSRPGMSTEKFNAVLARQMPDQLKRRHADHVVHTGLGRAFSFARLREILVKSGHA